MTTNHAFAYRLWAIGQSYMGLLMRVGHAIQQRRNLNVTDGHPTTNQKPSAQTQRRQFVDLRLAGQTDAPLGQQAAHQFHVGRQAAVHHHRR